MRIESVNSSQSNSTHQTTGQGSREVKVMEVQEMNSGQKERHIDEEQLMKAIEKANKSFEPFDRQFERSIHEKTNRTMVKVIDSSTGDVIREIPEEKLLDMVANMLEVAGILLDKKV